LVSFIKNLTFDVQDPYTLFPIVLIICFTVMFIRASEDVQVALLLILIFALYLGIPALFILSLVYLL